MFHKTKLSFVVIWAVILVSLFISLPGSPAPILSPLKNSTIISLPTFWTLTEKIDIGGRALVISCKGEGSPTIIFESGYRTTMACWEDIFDETSKYSKTCVYDRANLGLSDPAATPRTSQDMVDDLHRLLKNANVPAPFIMVGHSMGGFNALIFAHDYPGDVDGLILVDPSHPDQYERWLAILPAELPTQSESLKLCRQTLKTSSAPASTNDPNNPEGWDWPQSAEEVRSIKDLGDLPLTVITAGINSWPCYRPLADQEMKTWQANHQDYLKLSTNSKQILAGYSNHMVMKSEPELILSAMREMLDVVRK